MTEIFVGERRLKQQYLRGSYTSTGNTLGSRVPPYSSRKLFLFWFYRDLVFYVYGGNVYGSIYRHQR